MCGITGIFHFHGAPVDAARLHRMTEVIAVTAGPMARVTSRTVPVGLGHRRLSIIDLEGGSQPLSNEDDPLQMVFNGEIYNFIELSAELEAAGTVQDALGHRGHRPCL